MRALHVAALLWIVSRDGHLPAPTLMSLPFPMKSSGVAVRKFDCSNGPAPLGCKRFENVQIHSRIAVRAFGFNSDG